ncbi:MAG: hypothetical protein OXF56_11790 [Rhodobacteraceae bacterium]|nr:hypothetical protein [Paracoccaceae bacterium]
MERAQNPLKPGYNRWEVHGAQIATRVKTQSAMPKNHVSGGRHAEEFSRCGVSLALLACMDVSPSDVADSQDTQSTVDWKIWAAGNLRNWQCGDHYQCVVKATAQFI